MTEERFSLTNDRFRYFVLTLGCICLTSTSSNLFTFNIGQVCMAPSSNLTRVDSFPPVDYSPAEVSLLNQAMGIGTFVTTLPFIELFNRVGVKWPFFFGAILSALSTAAIPFTAEYSIWLTGVARFLQGAAYGGNFPAIGILCSKWSSLKQNGFCASILTSYGPLSLGIANAAGGMLCSSSLGWPFVFFVFAGATLLLLIFWVLFYDDEPQLSRKVSTAELEKIQRNKSASHIQGQLKTPYRVDFWRHFLLDCILLTDIVLITIWINVLVETFANNVLAVYSPYYIRNVLRYGVLETGYFSALCTVAQIPVRMLCGYISDHTRFISEDGKLLLFNSLSLAGAATIYMVLAFLSDENPFLIVILFTSISLCTGASSCGFVKCGIDYGRQYSNFILGVCQFMKSITLFLVPALIGIFVTRADSVDQWKYLYVGTAVSLYLANLMFWKYARSEPPEYTKDGFFEQSIQQLEPETVAEKKN